MSVMTTLVNHKTKKMLTLGKQWWGEHLDLSESNRRLLLDRTHLLEVVVMSLRHGGSSVRYAIYLRDLIHDFIIDTTEGQLEMLTDSNDGARLWQLEKAERYTDKLCTHTSAAEVERYIMENY